MPPGDALALPAGQAGPVDVALAGAVPATIDADGEAVLVHPRVQDPPPPPTGRVQVTGSVSPAAAGVTVMFLAPGTNAFQGAQTQADGSFAFEVAADAPIDGLVVARTAAASPALAIANLTVDPASAPAPLGLALEQAGEPIGAVPSDFRLLGSDASPPEGPPPPQDMAYEAAVLQVLEGHGQNTWAVNLLEVPGTSVPRYALHGHSQLVTLRAANPDHTRGTTVVGPLGGGKPHLKKPLPAPDLAAMARPAPGVTLSWPAVQEANLYTVRVYSKYFVDPPLWEGASRHPSLPLPAGLDALAGEVRVQVDAWNAPGVTLYSVASAPRQLRIPTDPGGPLGRHSWAIREYP